MTLQAFRSNEDMPRCRAAWNGIRGKAYTNIGIVLGTVKGRDLSERPLLRQRGAVMRREEVRDAATGEATAPNESGRLSKGR
jgi:hypothetical protein